ncbi:MAG: hypothetical protein LW875_08435 [Proteobacteria bacterium]|jgi:hypothetical protein|nr:hypothetical protein [Pseudomonadota bacterium]
MSRLFALVLMLGSYSWAQTEVPQYLKITQVQIQEVQLPETLLANGGIGSVDCRGLRPLSATDLVSDVTGAVSGEVNPLDQLDMMVDKIINIGKKIWKIVEAGKPVVNFRTDVATAMPAGAQCWDDLEGWQFPTSKAYRSTFKNVYGITVVDFTYRVTYLYGGSANGVGKYIGYATVSPVNLNVLWGFTFNSTATIPTTYNMGSKSKPVAGMQVLVQWKVESAISSIEQSQAFALNGLGAFQELK